MKKIGSRKSEHLAGSQQSIDAARRMLQLSHDLRGKRPLMPRGVYRFKTFLEAQEWSLKMISRHQK